jgi:ATP-dependent DNA helicase RecG
MDKFGEAICAFANDLPNNEKPGYLILGADDKTGKVVGIKVTDALLKNIGSIRVEGNIQPQPSMTVEKVGMDGGDLIVVEVEPAHFCQGHIRWRLLKMTSVISVYNSSLWDFTT